jgi:hypothetical protein
VKAVKRNNGYFLRESYGAHKHNVGAKCGVLFLNLELQVLIDRLYRVKQK